MTILFTYKVPNLSFRKYHWWKPEADKKCFEPQIGHFVSIAQSNINYLSRTNKVFTFFNLQWRFKLQLMVEKFLRRKKYEFQGFSGFTDISFTSLGQNLGESCAKTQKFHAVPKLQLKKWRNFLIIGIFNYSASFLRNFVCGWINLKGVKDE